MNHETEHDCIEAAAREAERDEEMERETIIYAALDGWRRALRIARETEAA
jgi:hypothetical protein